MNIINQNMTQLSRTIVDLDRKQKMMEQKLNEMDTLISRLQSRVVDMEMNRPTTSHASSSMPSEERLKSVVREYVDGTLKTMLSQPSMTTTTSNELPLNDVLPFDSQPSTMFPLEESLNDDDIVIEEKKKKAVKKSKKP